jgi:hypothetical protein
MENHKNPIAFFFDEFHSGTFNVIFHCLGFALLGYGVGTSSIYMITVATFVMEVGHFYNTLRGRHREYSFLAIPVQWIFWLLIVWGSYAIDALLRKYL